MKKFMSLSALVLALSASAFAAPKVGDLNQYAITFEVPGQKVDGTVNLKVTAINGAKATVEQEIDIMGQKQKSSDEVDTDSIAEEKAAEVVTNCVAMGGKLETIAVGGANMQTCALYVNEEGKEVTNYIGPVTFGLVKSVTIEQGMTTTMILKTVTRGQ